MLNEIITVYAIADKAFYAFLSFYFVKVPLTTIWVDGGYRGKNFQH
ncbi:hypothetical protein [Nostoc sp.]